jgi:hypothetical protein
VLIGHPDEGRSGERFLKFLERKRRAVPPSPAGLLFFFYLDEELFPMRRRFAFGTCLVVLACCACGSKGPKGMERDPVFKVTGVILVDGKPEAQISVACVRPKGAQPTGTSAPINPSGTTDPEGNFSIGTYESNDGVPNGEYDLTFAWGQIGLISGRYEGDRFKGKYKDPAKSEHKVTVDGEPIDLGTIELSTK